MNGRKEGSNRKGKAATEEELRHPVRVKKPQIDYDDEDDDEDDDDDEEESEEEEVRKRPAGQTRNEEEDEEDDDEDDEEEDSIGDETSQYHEEQNEDEVEGAESSVVQEKVKNDDEYAHDKDEDDYFYQKKKDDEKEEKNKEDLEVNKEKNVEEVKEKGDYSELSGADSEDEFEKAKKSSGIEKPKEEEEGVGIPKEEGESGEPATGESGEPATGESGAAGEETSNQKNKEGETKTKNEQPKDNIYKSDSSDSNQNLKLKDEEPMSKEQEEEHKKREEEMLIQQAKRLEERKNLETMNIIENMKKNTEILDLKTKVETGNLRIKDLEGDITTKTNKIILLEDKLTQANGKHSLLEEKVLDLEKIIDAKNRDVLNAKEQEVEANTAGQLQKQRITTLEKEKNEYLNKIDQLKKNFLGLKLDRDCMYTEISKNLYSPDMFLSDECRENFWRAIGKYHIDIEKIQEIKLSSTAKVLKAEKDLAKKNKKVQLQNKKLKRFDEIKEQNIKMRLEANELKDQFEILEGDFQELSQNYGYLEKRCNLQEQDREKAHIRIHELSTLMSERIRESEEEKKHLRDMLEKITRERSKKGSDIQDEFTRILIDPTKKFDINQFIMRLKTTAIASDKYGEAIDILIDLYRSEKESNAEGGKVGNSVEIKLKEPSIYSLFLKGVESKNLRVLKNSFKILRILGDVEDRIPEFLGQGTSIVLIKTYKKAEDVSVKQETIQFLIILCDSCLEIAEEFKQYGGIKHAADDLRKYTRGVNILSSFLIDLIHLISIILKYNFGQEEFEAPSSMNCIMICLNNEKRDCKVFAMRCILYVSQTEGQRRSLANYDCFNTILTHLIKALQEKDNAIINAAIASLAHFSKEKTYRILMLNSNKMFNFFSVLLHAIQAQDSSPAITRLSAIGIISRLLIDEELLGIKKTLIQDGILTYLVRTLRDEEKEIKKIGIQVTIKLSGYLEKDCLAFKGLVKPLVNALSEEDIFVVSKSLRCLELFAYKPPLLKSLVTSGLISVLCSFIMQDIREINKSILVNSVRVIILLMQNDDAKQIIFDTSLILSFLGFLIDDPDIRRLFYDGLKEFTTYSIFRSQLENANNVTNILKRAIRDHQSSYAFQIIHIIRYILESGIILEGLMADGITVPRLFKIYDESIRWGDQNLELFILETLRIIFRHPNGKHHILNSEIMLRYAVSSMLKENVLLSNQAALLLLSILQDGVINQNILKLPVVEGIIRYSKLNNPISISTSKELLEEIEEIEPLYHMYLIKTNQKQKIVRKEESATNSRRFFQKRKKRLEPEERQELREDINLTENAMYQSNRETAQNESKSVMGEEENKESSIKEDNKEREEDMRANSELERNKNEEDNNVENMNKQNSNSGDPKPPSKRNTLISQGKHDDVGGEREQEMESKQEVDLEEEKVVDSGEIVAPKSLNVTRSSGFHKSNHQ